MTKLPEFTGNFETETPEAKAFLKALGIPRRIDIGNMRALIEAVFPEYIGNNTSDYFAVRENLYKNGVEYLVWRLEIRGDTLSGEARSHLEKSDKIMDKPKLLLGHKALYKYERKCFEDLPDNLPIYAAEQIYHLVHRDLVKRERVGTIRHSVENDVTKIIDRLEHLVTADSNPLTEFTKRLETPKEDILKPLNINTAEELNWRLSLRHLSTP